MLYQIPLSNTVLKHFTYITINFTLFKYGFGIKVLLASKKLLGEPTASFSVLWNTGRIHL